MTLIAFAVGVAGFVCCSPLARADSTDGSCSAGVYRWIGEADAHNDARVRARACRGEHVVVTLEPANSEPYDVDLSPCAVATFRRAGGVCLQPRREVADFASLPEPERRAFEQLVAFVEAHGAALTTRSEGAHTASRILGRLGVDLGGAPILPIAAALLLLAAAHYTRRDAGASESRAPGAASPARVAWRVFVLALALRFTFGAWSLHHVHLGVLWVVAATSDPTELVRYGPGYVEVFSWLTRLVPRMPEYALFGSNAVVGAALAPLALWLARELRMDGRRALFLGLVVACDPVAVRFGATEAYHPILMLLSLGSGGLSLRAAHSFASGRHHAAALSLGAATLLAAQCVRVHPAGWPLVAFAVPLPPRCRIAAAASAAVVFGVGIALLDGNVVSGVIGSVADGELYQASWQLAPGATLLAIATVAAVLASPRARVLAPVALAHLAFWAFSRDAFAQTPLWQASYDRLHLLLPLVALCASVPERWAAHARAPLGFGAGAVLVLATQLSVLGAPRDTVQRERVRLRELLSALPMGCRVVHVAFAGRYGVFLPTYAAAGRPPGTFIRLDGRRAIDVASAVGAPQCLYYVHTSLCSSPPGIAACAEAERQMELERVTAWSVPAVPAYDYPGAVRGRVRVEMTRVRGLRAP